MKRLRVDRWAGQLLAARPGARICSPAAHVGVLRSVRLDYHHPLSVRPQSTSAAAIAGDAFEVLEAPAPRDHETLLDPTELPSPLPERALESAKLAALHARLSLPQKIPVQTLARTLIDASADENPHFNNTNLAFLGHTIINYHVAEWLMCRYPRLPMDLVWASMEGFAGAAPLFQIARSWGVEAAAAPGGEVDAGLLQFSLHKPGVSLVRFGYRRTEYEYLEQNKWRRGISNRVVFDDDFGGAVKITPGSKDEKAMLEAQQAEFEELAAEEDPSYMSYGNQDTRMTSEKAHANFVRAVTGAVYAHCGRDAAKSFIKAHILSRTLDFPKLFAFKKPTLELALLCAREDFEPPVARLLSETGRLSRTPVFVVGIYSGKDKLGEAAAASLDFARHSAAMNALKAWYLYSPGENVRVPSDMLVEHAKPWEPAHVDIGEIVSR